MPPYMAQRYLVAGELKKRSGDLIICFTLCPTEAQTDILPAVASTTALSQQATKGETNAAAVTADSTSAETR